MSCSALLFFPQHVMETTVEVQFKRFRVDPEGKWELTVVGVDMTPKIMATLSTMTGLQAMADITFQNYREEEI